MNILVVATTRQTPIAGSAGAELLAVLPDKPMAQALQQADHTLSSALAVLDQIPHVEGVQREELAYAGIELLRTAQALLAACRHGIEGDYA